MWRHLPILKLRLGQRDGRALIAALVTLLVWHSAPAAAQDAHTGHGHPPPAGAREKWRMVPMPAEMFMLPGIEGAVPSVEPFLPGAGIDPAAVSPAVFRRVIHAQDGDTLDLEATIVRRSIKGRTFLAYGFNGQYPGPLLRVAQHSTLYVRFKNSIDWPSTVHWHGLRLRNAFDGVPGVTQQPVMPGETFVYEVSFPDAGIYWYHPHHREDVTQGLGLYGNMLVDSPDPDYYGPANRDEVLILDDLLFDESGVFPFGREAPTHALMGRFGNLFLVNGEPDRELEVDSGEVVRLHVTNASNTRTYSLSFGERLPIKLVASDLSRFERELWVETVVIAPAERYVMEVRFDAPGVAALVNRVQALDHMQGRFDLQVDTLMKVLISPDQAAPDHSETFETLRSNEEVRDDIARYRALFDRQPDHSLTLTVQADGLPLPIQNFMEVDTVYFPPIEWNDAMPMMNWLSTGENVRWILRDDATGRENMDIDWRFDLGDVVKIRIFNDPETFHPMQHPIHLHGQRFLVLAQDGIPRTNHVWKDTAIIPTGSTVDLLVELSNPGDWMLHCHIAEHLGAGMMMVLTVQPPA